MGSLAPHDAAPAVYFSQASKSELLAEERNSRQKLCRACGYSRKHQSNTLTQIASITVALRKRLRPKSRARMCIAIATTK